jgi:hypothetical protein
VGGESASRKPITECPGQFTWTFELEKAASLAISHGKLTQVDSDNRFEIGAHDQIVPEAWIGVAEVRIVTPQHEPVLPARALEFEAHHLALRGQLVGMKVLEDPPHQKVRVKVLRSQLEPLLSPVSKPSDDICELLACLGQMVGRASTGRVGKSLDDAGPFQSSQALAENAWRCAMQTLEDFAEVVAAGHDLAKDQGSPALGEDLRRSRHGAELTVSGHGEIVGLGRSPSKYEFSSSK